MTSYDSKVQYFYTTEYPHRWGSGPRMTTWSGEGYISSLEEAKELAERHATVGVYDESRCVTTYGVFYRVDEKEKSDPSEITIGQE